MIFIEKTLETKLIPKQLPNSKGKVPLLYIAVKINDNKTEIFTGNKKALLDLAEAINDHFGNKKVTNYLVGE